MGLNNVFDDGQPEAGTTHVAAAGLVDPVEAFKQAFLVLFGDADSLVLEMDLNPVCCLGGDDPDDAFFGTVFDGMSIRLTAACSNSVGSIRAVRFSGQERSMWICLMSAGA